VEISEQEKWKIENRVTERRARTFPKCVRQELLAIHGHPRSQTIFPENLGFGVKNATTDLSSSNGK